MEKVIIVSRRLIRKNKLVDWVSEVYLELMVQNGIMPLIVPVANGTLSIINQYLSDYDGLLMMEGGDLGPHYYNEDYPIEELDEYDKLKDEIETLCFKHAYENKKPILGFCRGMHIINALLGGSNHLDVHKANNNSLLHIDYQHYDELRHHVKLVEGTPICKWYGQSELMVNSYHHQGIKKLANPLKAMAYADDGLIEGIFLSEGHFVVGLQFHPERMLDEYEGNRKVFKEYFNAIKSK
jgi:gamma-glutamyl-gamma-aminobutyrate hydrolase PuuD